MSFTGEPETSTRKSDLAIVAVLIVKFCKKGKPKSVCVVNLKIDGKQEVAWKFYSANGVKYYLIPKKSRLVYKIGNKVFAVIQADDERLADIRSKLGYLASEITRSDNQSSRTKTNKPEKFRETHVR